MPYLLNAAYLLAIVLASPWLLWSALFKGKYREGYWEKLLGQVPHRGGDAPCIWLHAVSVGEVNLLSTLLEELESRRPDVQCVISTTTMTGYALAKKKYSQRLVFYCPLDFTWAVGAAMSRIRPDLLLLAELELWPNLIDAATRCGAKVVVANGRLSEKSFRGYRRVRLLLKRTLAQIDLIAAQNEEYGERFRDLAPTTNVQITGSLKFDGAQTDRQNPRTRELARLAGIGPNDIVLLAGSTQSPEEELALAAFKELSPRHPNLRLILVPRHPDRFDEVARLLEQSGVLWVRRTQLSSDEPVNSSKVLLVDTIGELGAWWGTAQIAYVGGSMGSRGGQNMIEPAAYGAAISFGPKTKNFRDVVSQLLAAEAAEVVDDGEQMTSFVRRCLEDASYRTTLGQRASQLVAVQLGATKRTIDLLAPLLPLQSGPALARAA